MNPELRRQRIDVYRDGLLEDTIEFWIKHAVDRQYGGLMTALDRDGTIIDTDKGVWQQARFIWLLGKLYNSVEPRSEWLELATAGAAFLDEFAYDYTDGRMWFQLTRDGRPIRKRRYAFSESFAAIAYGELAKATGEHRFVVRAINAFQRFVAHHANSSEVASKTTDVRRTRSFGFPMITIGIAQELRESIEMPDAQRWIDRSIDQIRRYHIKTDIECVMENVGMKGEQIDHFDGRQLNPGHAIEGAWFIMREGEYRSDRELIDLGCEMLDWMWLRGWDRTHGGMLYYTDVRGLPVQEYWHDMKFWWPQNETIIATLLAYTLTGNKKYQRWYEQIHSWAYQHFPDPEYGEWFGYLHRDGTPSSTLKGNLWKGPFHLPRMQLTCWKLLASW